MFNTHALKGMYIHKRKLRTYVRMYTQCLLTILSINVTGLQKPGTSAQITHVQKIVCFLVTAYDKSAL